MTSLFNIIHSIRNSSGIEYQQSAKDLYLFFSAKKYEKPSSDFIHVLGKACIEEAYNNAIINLLDNIQQNTFRADSTMHTYFYRILKNKLIDMYQKERKKGVVNVDSSIEQIINQSLRLDEIENIIHTAENPETLLIHKEEIGRQELYHRELINCLREIKEQCIKKSKHACCDEVLILWANNYTHQAMAIKLQIPLGSISTKIESCVSKLQRVFASKGYLS
jgi:DNA-directed RNA polymerase specialized sigma24 family protein